jgi:hypothetical protein
MAVSLSPEEEAPVVAEFIRRYEAGETVEEIADATHWSTGFVYGRLQEESVVMRRQGRRVSK